MGHVDEVSCLATVGPLIVSGSLDGTIRQWDLKQMKRPSEVAAAKKAAANKPPVMPVTAKQPATATTGMTEEEERELEELMAEDDNEN